jgi:hypothetical protein
MTNELDRLISLRVTSRNQTIARGHFFGDAKYFRRFDL